MADEEPTTTATDAPEEDAPQETGTTEAAAEETNGDAAAAAAPTEDAVTGSTAIRPVFLGNLKPNYAADDIIRIFEQPVVPPGTEEGTYKPIPVDRLDQKRGYCFVFLKDAIVQDDKDNAEKFVAAISGM